MKLKFVINDISYRYLALLTIFIGVPLLDRLKWKIATLVRLGELITILVLAGLTDSLFTLHHK